MQLAPDIPSTPNRIFLDVDFINFLPTQDTLSVTSTRTLFGETASARASYGKLPRIQDWIPEPSVRVMLGHRIGVGFRFLWSHYDEIAALGITIPHPTLPNRFGNDVDVSPVLERKDLMFDFNAQYVYNETRWRYVLLGGPTYFRTTNEMVRSISYSQFFSLAGTNLVSITGAPSNTVKGSAWGFNVGGDIAFFPWRRVGFGGGALLNNGRIHVVDPLSAATTDLTMGSTSLMFGPRFRF